jgi:hypothetical protein
MLKESDLHYLKSILGQLRDVRRFMDGESQGWGLGAEVLADNIDWLDCFIDRNERARAKMREDAQS